VPFRTPCRDSPRRQIVGVGAGPDAGRGYPAGTSAPAEQLPPTARPAGKLIDERREAPDGRVHIARDKKLPMLPLSQVYPNYPEDARMRAWEDELVVRYVIGKDGRVKEVTIISAPQRDVFVDGTVRAIRSWRFKPMIKDGERMEVVHELTVYYRLNQT